MKIKTWLLISYLLMMVLPLLSAYFLFVSISNYYDTKKVDQFYEVKSRLSNLHPILRDPTMYTGNLNESLLDAHSDETVQIKLYRHDGAVLYTTIHEVFQIPNVEELYTNLYEVDEHLNTFTYKEPVFDEGQLIGLYEVEMYREHFVQTMKERTWITFGIFIAIFLLIYVLMMLLLHQKVNKRLNHLKEEMTAFASGSSYEKMKTSHDEIGQLQQHFYNMREEMERTQSELEEEQKEKEYMIAAISHDLKTPLTSIKAYAEALQDQEMMSEDKQQIYKNTIIEKADFMKQMLDDLTTYTLLQGEKAPLEKVQVDGAELFEMLLADYDALCEKKNIQLITKNTVQHPLLVNVKEMIRVIDNFVVNAVHHSKMDGVIHILAFENIADVAELLFPFVDPSFSQREDMVYVAIQNEGKGIPNDKIGYIFDPLYQVDGARSKRDAIGSGLGLTIAKSIVEMHGGELFVYSKENIGVCFVMMLPKMREDME